MKQEDTLVRVKMSEDTTEIPSTKYPHTHAEDPNTVFSEYPNEPSLRDLSFNFKTIARWPLLGLIRGYQAVVSPSLPVNTCRFYPSCSHYGYQAIYKHGAYKGGWLAFKRVFKCNPFNPGGFDPVP